MVPPKLSITRIAETNNLVITFVTKLATRLLLNKFILLSVLIAGAPRPPKLFKRCPEIKTV